MEIQLHTVLMGAVHHPLQVGDDHLPHGGQAEEGSPLGAPVIVEVDHVAVQILLVVHHVLVIEGGQLIEEAVHRFLLILVDEGEGGVFKIHEGDEPLEEAGEDGDHQGAAGLDVALLIPLAHGLPVHQILHLGEGDIVLPMVEILHLGLAGTDHGAAHGGDILPFHAEHVRAAGLAQVQFLRLEDEAAGDIVRAHGGDHLGVAVAGHPEGELLAQEQHVVLLGGDGGIEDGGGLHIGTEAGVEADGFQFLGVKGDTIHLLHSSFHLIFILL